MLFIKPKSWNSQNACENSKHGRSLDLHCLSRPFWQTTNVQNFRTFNICAFNKLSVIESIVTLVFCYYVSLDFLLK